MYPEVASTQLRGFSISGSAETYSITSFFTSKVLEHEKRNNKESVKLVILSFIDLFMMEPSFALNTVERYAKKNKKA